MTFFGDLSILRANWAQLDGSGSSFSWSCGQSVAGPGVILKASSAIGLMADAGVLGSHPVGLWAG